MPQHDLAWQELAACRGTTVDMDPDLDDRTGVARAKRVCNGFRGPLMRTDPDGEVRVVGFTEPVVCPVRASCLSYAMTLERTGDAADRACIYGGLDARERAELAGHPAFRRPGREYGDTCINPGTSRGAERHHRLDEDQCDECASFLDRSFDLDRVEAAEAGRLRRWTQLTGAEVSELVHRAAKAGLGLGDVEARYGIPTDVARKAA